MGTGGFQIQSLVDRKKHIHTYVLFCFVCVNIHTADLVTSEVVALLVGSDSGFV